MLKKIRQIGETILRQQGPELRIVRSGQELTPAQKAYLQDLQYTL